jgi:hypothetical protein
LGVLQTTDDERLLNRAQLGLARIYEIRGELDKARQEYLKVKGAYEEYAKLQAERLEQPEAKETYEWLASAQPPRPRAPLGPGSPGTRPEFSADDLGLPNGQAPGGTTAPPESTMPTGETFDNLLEGLNLDFGETQESERYPAGESSAGEEPPSGLGTPASEDSQPPQETAPAQDVPPPATESPAADEPADTSTDTGDTPASESPQQ